MRTLPQIEDGAKMALRYRKQGPTIASMLRAMKPGQFFVVRRIDAPKWRTYVSQRDFQGKFYTESIKTGVRVVRKDNAQLSDRHE